MGPVSKPQAADLAQRFGLSGEAQAAAQPRSAAALWDCVIAAGLPQSRSK
jgi:hypothetical protein